MEFYRLLFCCVSLYSVCLITEISSQLSLFSTSHSSIALSAQSYYEVGSGVNKIFCPNIIINYDTSGHIYYFSIKNYEIRISLSERPIECRDFMSYFEYTINNNLVTYSGFGKHFELQFYPPLNNFVNFTHQNFNVTLRDFDSRYSESIILVLIYSTKDVRTKRYSVIEFSSKSSISSLTKVITYGKASLNYIVRQFEKLYDSISSGIKSAIHNYQDFKLYGNILTNFSDFRVGDVFACKLLSMPSLINPFFHFMIVVESAHLPDNAISFGMFDNQYGKAGYVNITTELQTYTNNSRRCIMLRPHINYYTSYVSKVNEALETGDLSVVKDYAYLSSRYSSWYDNFKERVKLITDTVDFHYSAIHCNCQTIVDYIAFGTILDNSLCTSVRGNQVIAANSCNWKLYNKIISVFLANYENKSFVMYLDSPGVWSFNCEKLPTYLSNAFKSIQNT
ncbi:unnamed protein product [Macrosiphum euphorbiae]|uniref:Uncharacterized protein n=1 Tax=Macrosiphum euphorbiae TaxID=13131 RepID=A0AAV0W6V7_9HEMI|nr:unnamed protein product [Macrosiphum euphorbiae]